MRRMFDDIKKKLDGYSEPAPDGLWERIEAGYRQPHMKKGAGRLWKAAAAITAAAAVTAGIVLSPPYRQQERTGDTVLQESTVTAEVSAEPAADEEAKAQQIMSDTASIMPINRQAEVLSGLTAENRLGETGEKASYAGQRNDINYIYEKNAVLNSHGQNGSVQETAEERMTTKENRVHEKVVTDDDVLETDTEGIEQRLSGNGAVNEGNDVYGRKMLSAESEEKKSRGLFSVGISVSNSPGGSTSEQGYTSLSGYSAYPMPATASLHGLWIDPEANMKMHNRNENVNSDTRHRLPVRTGITVRYRLPSGLGIETGVVYSWLSSTFQSGSETSYYISTREMHYAGVPLNLSYSIWDSRFVSIYVSAGGLMEKCVGGSTETAYVIGGESMETTRNEPLDTRPLQWSVNATAGVQINFIPAIGLYIEPGAAYYFDDGTDLQTVYKVRPFDFYLRFGLRFSFGL